MTNGRSSRIASLRSRLGEYLKLYLVTDRVLGLGRPEEEIVAAAIRGGVTAVQLRAKDWTTREMVSVAQRLRSMTLKHDVLFIVNDRLDVAMAVGADGVHLGQDDMPCSMAREILGNDFIIGITVENSGQAVKAEADGADYLGTAAVFATATKEYPGEPLGLEGLKAVVQSVSVPVVAIGGIKPHNAKQVLDTGVAGIAVVSAIVSQPDVESAAATLKNIIVKS